MSLSLANISSTTTGVSGILMAVPQIGGLFSNSTANTIGYQPIIPGQPVNPPALIFHYEGEQTATLESDITDHYVENNSSIQDQIALRPETITTHGFIGELTNAPPNSVLAALQVAANKLTTIPGLSPQFTTSAIEAYNQATFAYATAANAASAGLSAFSSITGGGGEAVIGNGGISNTSSPNPFGVSTQGKQQVYFQQFYSYWTSRTLFTVQTPWAVFQNMAIKTLRAIQDAETNTITDFEVTFKMMRFASVGGTSQIAGAQKITADPISRLASQAAAKVSFTGVNASKITKQPVPPTGIPGK